MSTEAAWFIRTEPISRGRTIVISVSRFRLPSLHIRKHRMPLSLTGRCPGAPAFTRMKSESAVPIRTTNSS